MDNNYVQMSVEDVLLDLEPNKQLNIIETNLEDKPVEEYNENINNYTGPTVAEYADKYNKLLENEESIIKNIDILKNTYKDIFSILENYENNLSEIAEEKEKIRQDVTEAMEAANLPDYSSGKIKISYVKASDKETFDTKSFKAKYPVLAKEFIKITHSSAYSRISLIKNK